MVQVLVYWKTAQRISALLDQLVHSICGLFPPIGSPSHGQRVVVSAPFDAIRRAALELANALPIDGDTSWTRDGAPAEVKNLVDAVLTVQRKLDDLLAEVSDEKLRSYFGWSEIARELINTNDMLGYQIDKVGCNHEVSGYVRAARVRKVEALLNGDATRPETESPQRPELITVYHKNTRERLDLDTEAGNKWQGKREDWRGTDGSHWWTDTTLHRRLNRWILVRVDYMCEADACEPAFHWLTDEDAAVWFIRNAAEPPADMADVVGRVASSINEEWDWLSETDDSLPTEAVAHNAVAVEPAPESKAAVATMPKTTAAQQAANDGPMPPSVFVLGDKHAEIKGLGFRLLDYLWRHDRHLASARSVCMELWADEETESTRLRPLASRVNERLAERGMPVTISVVNGYVQLTIGS